MYSGLIDSFLTGLSNSRLAQTYRIEPPKIRPQAAVAFHRHLNYTIDIEEI
jgi:hypothetical protein